MGAKKIVRHRKAMTLAQAKTRFTGGKHVVEGMKNRGSAYREGMAGVLRRQRSLAATMRWNRIHGGR